MKWRSTKGLLETALSLDYFTADDDGVTAIPYHHVPGPRSKLVVVVGDNAGGKSFFRRIIQALCQKAKVECIAISAEGRRQIGHAPWLTFVYGDESWELDALPPQMLLGLIRQHALALCDNDLRGERVALQEEQREVLQAAADRWDDVSDFLGEE